MAGEHAIMKLPILCRRIGQPPGNCVYVRRYSMSRRAGKSVRANQTSTNPSVITLKELFIMGGVVKKMNGELPL